MDRGNNVIDQELLAQGTASYDENAGAQRRQEGDPNNGDQQSSDGSGDNQVIVDPRTLPQIGQSTTLADLVAADKGIAGLDAQQAAYADLYNKQTDWVEKQRLAAGKPLNRILSGVQGVLGLPMRLVENVLDGENNDLTAPFRPQSTANTVAQERLAMIAKMRAETLSKLDQAKSSRLSVLKNALTDSRAANQDMFNRVANLAIQAKLGDDPKAQAQFFNQNADNLLKTHPEIASLLPGFGPREFSSTQNLDQYLTSLISYGDDATQRRFLDMVKGTNVAVSQGGGVFNVPSLGGRTVTQMFQRGDYQQPPGAFGFATEVPVVMPQQQQPQVQEQQQVQAQPTAVYETPAEMPQKTTAAPIPQKGTLLMPGTYLTYDEAQSFGLGRAETMGKPIVKTVDGVNYFYSAGQWYEAE